MDKEKIYCKNVKRPASLIDIKAWYLGESKELEKWLGTGFFNHLFVIKNGFVQLYYDEEEGNKFWEILNSKLNEEFFDKLCDYFFEIIEKSKTLTSNQEIFDLMVKSWPALSIFDEISKHPEIANDNIIKRLIRVRQSTESFSYELSKKFNHEPEPEEYIFFKGEMIQQPFEYFIKQNNIIIKDG